MRAAVALAAVGVAACASDTQVTSNTAAALDHDDAIVASDMLDRRAGDPLGLCGYARCEGAYPGYVYFPDVPVDPGEASEVAPSTSSDKQSDPNPIRR